MPTPSTLPRRRALPKVGQRIVRSTIAVAMCYVVYELRGRRGIPFYSMLAALQCMQPYANATRQTAKARLTGTMIGAFWGLVVILLQVYALPMLMRSTLVSGLCVALFTGVVLYTAVALNVRSTAYFSCVVFLSIVVNHIGDANPVRFVANRVLDTLIGVVLALVINALHLPRQKQQDTLFVSGIDDTLLTHFQELSPYSRVELNRMLDDGAHFTISTIRTPASAREVLEGARLRLPIIAMDGAVLYDMESHSYLLKRSMRPEQAEQAAAFLTGLGLNLFTNTVTDDLLVIYYGELSNPAECDLLKVCRRSPWRNYLHSATQICENVVYLMALDEKARILDACEQLTRQPFAAELRFTTQDSSVYPGYTHLRVYHKDATREAMLALLKERLHLEKTVTFGSIEGRYDVLIRDPDGDEMVHTLKRLYEPVCLPFTRKGKG